MTWGLRQVTLSLKVTSCYNWTTTTTGGYGEVHRSLKEVKMGLRVGNFDLREATRGLREATSDFL